MLRERYRSLRESLLIAAVLICVIEVLEVRLWTKECEMFPKQWKDSWPPPKEAPQTLRNGSVGTTTTSEAKSSLQESLDSSESSTSSSNDSTEIVPSTDTTTLSSTYTPNLDTLDDASDPETPDSFESDTLERQQARKLQQAFEQYQQWHSDSALQTDFDNPNRKYAIGVFSCPMSAGNRYHQFMNTITNAMMTNRTVLYMYLDPETCGHHWAIQLQMNNSYDFESCAAGGTEQVCHDIVDFPDWIPRWNTWAPKLGFNDLWTARRLDYWSFKNYEAAADWRKEWIIPASPVESLPQPDQVYDHLVDFPVMVSREDVREPQIQDRVYATDFSKTMWRTLWGRGSAYLYGFLLKELLPLQAKHHVGAPVLQPNTLSIALHSRHPIYSYTGEDVTMEIECLQEILQAHGTDRPCHLCLMSDRPVTIQKLHVFAKLHTSCTSFSVEHQDISHSKEMEHGPHAGLGFLQELQVCGQSNAFVGNSHGSSSTLLLESMITYGAGENPVPKCWFHRKQPWEE